MNRLTNYQSIAIISLFDAENKFDLVNQELAKIKEVLMELKEISHEVANWTKLYGTLLQVLGNLVQKCQNSTFGLYIQSSCVRKLQ